MRMDEDRGVTASDLVNNSSIERLQSLLWDYAQERWAKLIARAIVEERQIRPLTSSRQLALLIEATIPAKYRSRKRHPATKTFQALRIAVNRELHNISDFLEKAPPFLVRGGRLVVISYHSLEDRLVKQAFLHWDKWDRHPRKLPVFASEGKPAIGALQKRAYRPRQAELNGNPRSRSARMRVAVRV